MKKFVSSIVHNFLIKLPKPIKHLLINDFKISKIKKNIDINYYVYELNNIYKLTKDIELDIFNKYKECPVVPYHKLNLKDIFSDFTLYYLDFERNYQSDSIAILENMSEDAALIELILTAAQLFINYTAAVIITSNRNDRLYQSVIFDLITYSATLVRTYAFYDKKNLNKIMELYVYIADLIFLFKKGFKLNLIEILPQLKVSELKTLKSIIEELMIYYPNSENDIIKYLFKILNDNPNINAKKVKDIILMKAKKDIESGENPYSNLIVLEDLIDSLETE